MDPINRRPRAQSSAPRGEPPGGAAAAAVATLHPSLLLLARLLGRAAAADCLAGRDLEVVGEAGDASDLLIGLFARPRASETPAAPSRTGRRRRRP